MFSCSFLALREREGLRTCTQFRALSNKKWPWQSFFRSTQRPKCKPACTSAQLVCSSAQLLLAKLPYSKIAAAHRSFKKKICVLPLTQFFFFSHHVSITSKGFFLHGSSSPFSFTRVSRYSACITCKCICHSSTKSILAK
jgi:hypothetical protein